MKEYVVCLFLFGAVISENYNCDFSFGDPTWDYSKLFYNRKHVIPAGATLYNVTLPHEKNQMISFVCVNLTAVDLSTVQVAYASLFRRVTIFLTEPSLHDVSAIILALDHGY
ncbi:uncharacterized protein LOC123704832 isoform X1 [Colias croceus]|uniref:uncharacterized protein LOC123704832 isoform X1 n=1 Tax=Colias crocea TaxID=72248 RepID=UPI001E27A818|nr:uncharacterized protein LOC123704832 isoform X1 [Colias croceus]